MVSIISDVQAQCYSAAYFKASRQLQNLLGKVRMNTVKPRFNGQMRTNDSPLLEKVR